MAWGDRKLFFYVPAISLVLAMLFAVPTTTQADDTLLTLSNPRIAGPHGVIKFTRADLEAMQQVEITTSNAFMDHPATFRGPSAYALIDQIGRAGANVVRLSSANEFFIDVDIAELADYGVILAIEVDDKRLTMRDRGPIWLMYPVDQFEELQNPSMNNRLIWHLQTIELQ